MAPSKRSKFDEDPTRDDSSDEDFDNHAPRSPRPAKRSRPKSHSQHKKPPRKKQRRRNDDSDIDEDDDDISEESWSDEQEMDEDVEINPDTNRPVRRATKGRQTYEESDEEDEAFMTDSDQSVKQEDMPTSKKRGQKATSQRLTQGRRVTSNQSIPSPIKSVAGRRTTRLGSRALSVDPTVKKSKIVVLNLPPEELRGFATANIPASRQSSARPARNRASSSASAPATRRATRASPAPADMFELNDKGEPVIMSSSQSQAGSRPSTANPGRSNSLHVPFGGKSLQKPGKFPSTIMEDSQEKSQSQAVQLSEDEEDDLPKPAIADTRENSPADAEGEDEDDDDDEGPVSSNRRGSRRALNVADSDDELQIDTSMTAGHATKRPRLEQSQRQNSQKRKRSEDDEDEEFNPDADGSDDNNMSDGENPKKRPRTGSSQTASGRNLRSRRNSNTDDDVEFDEDDIAELEEEAMDLATSKQRRQLRRARARSDSPDLAPKRLRRTQYKEGQYQVAGNADDIFLNPDNFEIIATENVGRGPTQDSAAAYNGALARRKGKVGPWAATTNTAGVFGGGNDRNLAGGLDTDSSDDEANNLPLTSPRTGLPKKKGAVGFAEDFGRIDPSANDALGVNAHLGFGSVGGLDINIKELKDMVLLPLLYPDAFTKFNKKPPRGVLFHGPPGTGKTSLARAVAASMSKTGKKVTFFMRKGADVLSKYVGEAERQLKALFDEAKKCQPSIIFFDEIDGLAPLRKSSSEQIHNTIVACLLSHMDGLDDRGQVVIIGATNRPDQIDEALRRPGRFDKELYFPLPDVAARKVILDIHTKGFDPEVSEDLKLKLAEMTKGCSGADIESLCREATLAAIQRTFPQIYNSDQKLEIDVNQIEVKPKDFLLTLDKIVPSSQRSAATAMKPKKTRVEPLIRRAVDDVIKMVGDIMPQKRKTTALEEAMFDDHDDPMALEFYELEKTFREARVHRPRLLISGLRGMGQAYLATAILAKFEMLHLQSFDLPTLLEDSSRSPEATVVQLFKEVRRHKPAIIFIPNVNIWWDTLDPRTARLFTQMLQGLDANDEIMVLGIMSVETDEEYPDPGMMRDLFGFTKKSEYKIQRPDADARKEFFSDITAYISRSPAQLPQPENRKPRHLPELPLAPVQAEENPAFSETELKAQYQRDLYLLNHMKGKLRPILASIKSVYRNLAQSAFDLNSVPYTGEQSLIATDMSLDRLRAAAANGDENVPTLVPTVDKQGINGILHVPSGHIFYNISTQTIDARLENGAYHHPEDFQADFHRLISDFTHIHLVVENPRVTAASDLTATIATDLYALTIEDLQYPEYAKIRERFRLRKEIQAKKIAAKRAEEKRKQQENPHARTSSQNGSPLRLMSPPKKGRSPRHSSRSRSPTAQMPDGVNGNQQRLNPSALLASMAAHNTPIRQVANTSSQGDGPLTQSSFIHKIPPGMSMQDYYNSASTTTSGQTGQKTSQPSNGSATRQGDPDFSGLHEIGSGGSQIPDTQPNSNNSGSTQSRSTQAPNTQSNKPAPSVSFDDSIDGSQQRSPDKDGFRFPGLPSSITHTPSRIINPPTTAVSALLNPASPDKPQPQPALILDQRHLSLFLDELVTRSSGLSVEQLEQVFAVLMSSIWQHKAEWNRNSVVDACARAFNEVILDIESMQRILMSSLETEERRLAGLHG